MNNMRRYETFIKLENNRYYFLGWYEMRDDTFCINTKTRKTKDKDYIDGKWVDTVKTWIYKTYKYLNGDIETYKYGSYVEEAE